MRRAYVKIPVKIRHEFSKFVHSRFVQLHWEPTVPTFLLWATNIYIITVSIDCEVLVACKRLKWNERMITDCSGSPMWVVVDSGFASITYKQIEALFLSKFCAVLFYTRKAYSSSSACIHTQVEPDIKLHPHTKKKHKLRKKKKKEKT